MDRDDRLVLTNEAGKTMVVKGYSLEPYLRFDGRGVWMNQHSPSRWLDVERFPDKPLPKEANAALPPVWKLVSPGRTWEWHDHRIHWLGKGTPDQAITPVNGKIEVIRWRVPLVVGETQTLVTGTLDYFAPGTGRGGGLGSGLILAIALPCAGAAAVAVGWLLLRRRRRSAAA